jgi:hypothetical protein
MKLLLAVILFFGLSVSAGETINKPVMCDALLSVQDRMKEFGESVLWTSPSIQEESDYAFYGNRETGAWTLVQIIKGVGCLVAFGEAGKRVRAGS